MEERGKAKAQNHGETRQHQNQLQQVWSWGAGTDGQLGTGKLQDELLPQFLHLLFLSPAEHILMLACGGAHVIALSTCGRAFSWGRGTSGQLGHGEMISSLHPKPVISLESHCIVQVSAGWNHSGFVSDTGCLFTCGDGSYGQLGHGDYESRSTMVKVSYFADNHVAQIACGMRHSLVLLKDCSRNQVYAFGCGKRGQLGISEGKVTLLAIPQAACGFEDISIVSISANGDHSAALSVDGRLFLWGRGFAGTSNANIPQCLYSSAQFVEAAFGWNHALVLTCKGEVYMLGGSHHGVLNDPEKIRLAKHIVSGSTEAILGRVSGVDTVKVLHIAAGAEHSAVVTADGAAMTWGWGEHGQLGLGNTNDETSPQAVTLCPEFENEESSLKIYCGSGFTFAVRSKFLTHPDD